MAGRKSSVNFPMVSPLVIAVVLFVAAPALSYPIREVEKKDDLPQQVHIGQGKEPTSMIISWVTQKKQPSVVQYGIESGVLSLMAEGDSTTYKRGSYVSPHIHQVKIKHLSPSTTYYYQLSGDTSRELAFTTLAVVGPESPLTFTVIGDLGQSADSVKTVQHVLEDFQQMTVLAGDLSYADGDQTMWDRWLTVFEPLFSSRPLQVAAGNHEIETVESETATREGVHFQDGVPPTPSPPFQTYQARFMHGGTDTPDEPDELRGMSNTLFYSYKAGPAHFIHLCTYADYGDLSPQKTWLISDLTSIDRHVTPWVFVVMHAPWYNSNKVHQDDPQTMRASLEQLLCEAKVDAVFAGHVHAYERGGPAYNGTRMEGGLIYINVGDGGNHEGLAPNYEVPQPDWSVKREASFGHGKVSVLNSTHALWVWQRNNDGEMIAGDTTLLAHPSGAACPSR